MGLRAALKFGAAACVLFLISIAGMAPASANVHVITDIAVRGDNTIVTFHVPNESETGSPTTESSIVLLNVKSASTDVMAGWKSRLQRDLTTGVIRSTTWTAGAVALGQHPRGTEPAPPASTPSVAASPAAEKPELHGDNVARALAGSALLVAAIGAGVALVRRGA